MFSIRSTDKRTGITYEYNVESYYDKEKKQARNHRTLVGKVDPVTGEVVPTGKRGRKPKKSLNTTDCTPENFAAVCEDNKKLKAQIDELTAKVKSLKHDVFLAKNETESYKSYMRKLAQGITAKAGIPSEEQGVTP